MRRIDLHKLIEDQQLDVKELAKALFPGNAHPDRALERHLKLMLELTESQIYKLSEMTGLTIMELFNGNGWDTRRPTKKCWEFSFENFRAELDPKYWLVKVFDGNKLIHESIYSDEKSIDVREFLTFLDGVVHKYKQQKN